MELPEFDETFLSRRRANIHKTANTTANIRIKPVIDTAMAKVLCDTQIASSGV